jgi:transposase-like protein
MRPHIPTLAALLDGAENNVLAYMDFPQQHGAKTHKTTSLDRPNGEIKRRADVITIFRNEDAASRLVGARLLERTPIGQRSTPDV